MKLTSGLALAVVTSVVLSSMSPAQAQSVFSDVPDNHWAAAAVKRLAEAGIIVGQPGATQASATQVSSTQVSAAQSSTKQITSTQATAPLAKSSTVSRRTPQKRTTASSKAPQRVVSAAESKNSSANSLSGNSR